MKKTLYKLLFLIGISTSSLAGCAKAPVGESYSSESSSSESSSSFESNNSSDSSNSESSNSSETSSSSSEETSSESSDQTSTSSENSSSERSIESSSSSESTSSEDSSSSEPSVSSSEESSESSSSSESTSSESSNSSENSSSSELSSSEESSSEASGSSSSSDEITEETANIRFKESFTKDAEVTTDDIKNNLETKYEIKDVVLSKVYGGEDKSVRIGASKSNGSISFTFSSNVKATKILVFVKNYNTDQDVPFTVTFGSISQSFTSSSEITSYTLPITTSETSNTITIQTEQNKKRIQLYAINIDTNNKEETSGDTSSQETSSETGSSSTTSSSSNDSSVTYTGSYYNGVSYTDGTTLANSLQTLMFSTHKTYTTYANLWTYLPKSDAKIGDSSKQISFYSREEITTENDGTWNREHVWPQSLSNGTYGTSGAGADMHHLRPTLIAENSFRGNKIFAQTSSSTQYVPDDCVKGDCARIVMYVYVHYSTNVNGTKNSSYCGDLELSSIFDSLDTIKKWNELDPVDEWEMQRNEVSYGIQGNRNPFIDHPEWVNTILNSL